MSKTPQQFISPKDLESYAKDLLDETALDNQGIQHLLSAYQLHDWTYAQLVHAKKLLKRTSETLIACQHLSKTEGIK